MPLAARHRAVSTLGSLEPQSTSPRPMRRPLHARGAPAIGQRILAADRCRLSLACRSAGPEPDFPSAAGAAPHARRHGRQENGHCRPPWYSPPHLAAAKPTAPPIRGRLSSGWTRDWRLRILALSFGCWGGGDIFRRELDYRNDIAAA